MRSEYSELQTIRKVGHLKATGWGFCNGVSNHYESQMPVLLQEILSTAEQRKYEAYVEQLNCKIKKYWPCLFAYVCGYVCVPCTLGLSLCLPRVCVSQVEEVLRAEVRRINEDVLRAKRLQMKLVKDCCDSYLLIEQIDFTQFATD